MDFDSIWKSAEVVDINRARERRGLPPITSPVVAPVDPATRKEHPITRNGLSTLMHMLKVPHHAHDPESFIGQSLEALKGIDIEHEGTLFDHAKILINAMVAHDFAHSKPVEENDSFPDHEVIQDHVHVEDAEEDLEPREGSKQATRVPLSKVATPVSLEEHMGQFGHSFSEDAIKNHVAPMRDAIVALESHYAKLSSDERMKLIAEVINHREMLHVDAHENGASSNGKDGAEFHIHSED